MSILNWDSGGRWIVAAKTTELAIGKSGQIMHTCYITGVMRPYKCTMWYIWFRRTKTWARFVLFLFVWFWGNGVANRNGGSRNSFTGLRGIRGKRVWELEELAAVRVATSRDLKPLLQDSGETVCNRGSICQAPGNRRRYVENRSSDRNTASRVIGPFGFSGGNSGVEKPVLHNRTVPPYIIRSLNKT